MKYTIFIKAVILVVGIPAFLEVNFNFVSQATAFGQLGLLTYGSGFVYYAFIYSEMLNIKPKVEGHMLVLVTFAFLTVYFVL